jgi:hypothetical protein
MGDGEESSENSCVRNTSNRKEVEEVEQFKEHALVENI